MSLFFGLMSLFAVCGAAAAVAAMHRIAVEVHHWITDEQFTDAYCDHAARARSERAYRDLNRLCRRRHPRRTGGDGWRCACLTALLAYYISRLLNRPSKSRWPGLIQAALVPLSIGLMAASALILAQSTDRTIAAVLLTAMVAVIASVSRINPLWLLLAGGLLGFAGIV
ncbi:chromate transporter [Bradyrhizobium sp. Rc3b]|nr:chromate transporter [Bradyrhizobium sp. Rc3b]SFM64178.1 chromate transporter [Bradyrhizobium sp. Rc3b]